MNTLWVLAECLYNIINYIISGYYVLILDCYIILLFAIRLLHVLYQSASTLVLIIICIHSLLLLLFSVIENMYFTMIYKLVFHIERSVFSNLINAGTKMCVCVCDFPLNLVQKTYNFCNHWSYVKNFIYTILYLLFILYIYCIAIRLIMLLLNIIVILYCLLLLMLIKGFNKVKILTKVNELKYVVNRENYFWLL